MASNTNEPNTKRQRLDQEQVEDSRSCFTTITLDMKRYSTWVRTLSEDELVSIFELGVKVRESFTLSVNVNQAFLEEALTSQMKPIQESVSNIETEVTRQVKTVQENVSREVKTLTEDLKDSLTKRVDTVAERVPPLSSLNTAITQSEGNIKTQIDSTFKEINSSESRVYDELKTCNDKLDQISKNLMKPGVKGVVGEMTVLKILKHRFPSWSVVDVSSTGWKMCDIVATTPFDDKIMIEVKNQTTSVPSNECNKFEENLTVSPDYKVGILLSLKSGISNHSSARDFEVKFLQTKNQYRIYVPNAMQEPDGNRVVWSVLMAEQLAQIRMELTGGQVEGLEEICAQFKKDVGRGKVCEESLRSLEKAMEKLKEDMSPFFETVRKTKESLLKLLHPVS